MFCWCAFLVIAHPIHGVSIVTFVAQNLVMPPLMFNSVRAPGWPLRLAHNVMVVLAVVLGCALLPAPVPIVRKYVRAWQHLPRGASAAAS